LPRQADGSPDVEPISEDQLLDNIMLYVARPRT
jgi:hypothetical protein